ncbi:MAG TPA: hypothetical protein PKW35_10450, partial [Nannocystaceae bacterium]|nr:hypothetical protein [Nannocystaceae bacterium]
RSDLFSLALLLWRLLTGKRPSLDPHPEAHRLTALLPRAPAPLVDALTAALQRDPTHRPDARTFRDALDDAAAELDALERGLDPPPDTVLAPGKAPPPPPPDSTSDRTDYARARTRRDRLRWRIVHVSAALGLAYLAFLVGLHHALDLVDPIAAHGRAGE